MANDTMRAKTEKWAREIVRLEESAGSGPASDSVRKFATNLVSAMMEWDQTDSELDLFSTGLGIISAGEALGAVADLMTEGQAIDPVQFQIAFRIAGARLIAASAELNGLVTE